MQENLSLFKKRNLFDLFNFSFKFLKQNNDILRYIVIIGGPFILISAYFNVHVSLFIDEHFGQVLEPSKTMDLYFELIQLNSFRFLLFFSFLNSIIISLIVYSYLILYETDKLINFSTISDFILKNFVKVSFSYLFMIILLISGLILFIAPGVWLMVPLQFYILIRLRESEALLDGVNRSISLMRGFWAESFMLILFVYIFTSFVDTIISFPSRYMLQSGDYYFVYNYFIAIIRGFIQFFLPLVSGLQYYNLRTKKDQIEIPMHK